MSQLGQTEKNSLRANVLRVAPDSGHCSMQSALRIRAISGNLAEGRPRPLQVNFRQLASSNVGDDDRRCLPITSQLGRTRDGHGVFTELVVLSRVAARG